MINFSQNNRLRYWVSLLVAALAALVLAFFLGAKSIWLVAFAAIYVMQTAIGNALYQGLQKSLQVLLLLAITALFVHSLQFFYVYARDVLLGSLIGILANLIVLPRKADVEFREKISLALMVYQRYLNNLLDCVRGRAELFDNSELENALLALPGWVHKLGFDAGLQIGYRFFLVKLEQIADVLFTLHYLARFHFDAELLAVVAEPLQLCQEKFNYFLTAMIDVLQLKKLTDEVKEFSQELDALEKQFYQLAPPSLELLDVRLDYVYFAELLYSLRDLHQYLVRLGEALR